MIIHISQDRFRAIVNQGYGLVGEALPNKFGPKIDIIEGGEYHLLDSEQAICGLCGDEQKSVPVDTPADLEVVKMALSVEYVMVAPLSTKGLRELIERNKAA